MSQPATLPTNPPAPTARVRAIEAHHAREAERARQHREDQARRAREQAERDAEAVAKALGGTQLGRWLPGVEWAFVERIASERDALVIQSVEDDGNAEPLRLVLRPDRGITSPGRHLVYVWTPGILKGRPVECLEDIGAALRDEEQQAKRAMQPVEAGE